MRVQTRPCRVHKQTGWKSYPPNTLAKQFFLHLCRQSGTKDPQGYSQDGILLYCSYQVYSYREKPHILPPGLTLRPRNDRLVLTTVRNKWTGQRDTNEANETDDKCNSRSTIHL